MTRAFIASTIVGLGLIACTSADQSSLDSAGPNGGPGDPGSQAPGATTPGKSKPGPATTAPAPPAPGACEAATHIGFGMTDFVADRLPGDIGTNRARVKPYSALATEFTRALGAVPTALASDAAAYGVVAARWYEEPTEGAVSLYTTYTLAFQACYDTMTAANYAVAPTATTAPVECATMQQKFWQRAPTA
jgi:hypothetical protein